jgi:protein associated with RNAse G/E
MRVRFFLFDRYYLLVNAMVNTDACVFFVNEVRPFVVYCNRLNDIIYSLTTLCGINKMIRVVLCAFPKFAINPHYEISYTIRTRHKKI